MRALKIDPETRVVTEIDTNKDPNKVLKILYDTIQCSQISLIHIGNGLCIAVDEDASSNVCTGGFRFKSSTNLVIAGAAVMLGVESGRFRDCDISADSIASKIRWVNPDELMELLEKGELSYE